MKHEQILIPVFVTAVIAGAVGFFGGMKYQQTQRSQQFVMGNGQGRNFVMRGSSGSFGSGGRGITQGFRPVSGEIIKADDTSITVKLQDGSSKIILVSETTTINKADSGTKADLKIGEKVAVFGNENTEGTVTAQNIQLNPMIRMIGTPEAAGSNN